MDERTHDVAAVRWGRLWLLLGLLWMATLPLRPLLDPDEGRYAEIPREMLATGDWVTPRLDGVKYFEKPALQYWGTAALYAALGVSEWTSRLWAVGLAFLCLPLVATFARAAGHSDPVAVRAALLLTVSPYYVVVGHLDLLDQAFTFFCCAMLFAFVLAQLAAERSSRERAWMLTAWAALALAVLSKGLVVIVLAGATLVAYMLLERSAAPLRRLHIALGAPLCLLIAAPWFLLVQHRNPEFAGFFFVHEHVARYLTRVHGRYQPVWYFVPILLLGLAPVLGQVPSAMRAAWREAVARTGAVRPRRFLLLWCGVTVVFFSLSDSKLAPYVLPAFPPLALLIAGAARDDARDARRAAWVTLGLLWAAGAAWLPLAIAGIVGWPSLLGAYSRLADSRPAAPVVAAVRDRIGPDTVLYSVGQYRPSVSFYLGRTLRVVAFTGEFEFGSDAQALGYVADLESFATQWAAAGDAVAFIDPQAFARLRAAAFPGRVLADDGLSIVVSRQ